MTATHRPAKSAEIKGKGSGTAQAGFKSYLCHLCGFFKSSTSSLILCRLVLPIIEREVLKSPAGLVDCLDLSTDTVNLLELSCMLMVCYRWHETLHCHVLLITLPHSYEMDSFNPVKILSSEICCV